MIPKTFHRIWIGSRPLPEKFQQYGESFVSLHPDWEFKLWTDADFSNCELLATAKRFPDLASQSDVLRLWVLYNFGGVYTDTDVECLKPFNPLLNGVTAFAGLEVPDRLCNAVMGAENLHPTIKWQLDNLPTPRPTPWGPEHLTKGIRATGNAMRIYPIKTFYPYRWDQPDEPHRYDLSESYAIHHWTMSWKPPRKSVAGQA